MNDRIEMRCAMVVANDSVQRRVIAEALTASGYSVTEAENGEVAVELLRQIKPMLIMLDGDLPGMSSAETCAAIRLRAEHTDTPIILMSEDDSDEEIARAFQLGITDFLCKPINCSLLCHRLAYLQQVNITTSGLREIEARNSAFLCAIPDLLLVANLDTEEIESVGGDSSHISDWLFADRNCPTLGELPDSLASNWKSQFERVFSDGIAQNGEFSGTKDGVKKYFETRVVPFTSDRVLIMIRDISKQKQTNAKVFQLAFFDTLTGLPNRQSFMTRLSEGICHAEENGSMLSVLYLDLDNFKRINDSLGHTLGDELLKKISKRIEKCVRADDYVARYGRSQAHLHLARLGGDEFTILLTDLESGDEAETVANRVTQAVSQPILHDEHEFVITPSIGIANYPDDGQDIDTLVKNADTAMYHAKEAGKNAYSMFSGTMSVRSLEHLDLEHSLRRAILNDDLELHYQPKLGLSSNEITGAEALLRWTHPERGSISPARFVPLAEEAGLILDLSNWVLNAVCKQIKTWESGAMNDVPIAINLSGKQFAHSDMYNVVTSALREYSINPKSIDLELTENELMRDADGTIATLTKLRDTGLSIAVDDFGTGYSSLSYLKKFPIDALKIDRSFVTDMDKADDNLSICAAIIALAHSLNLTVIAEGVETEEHRQLLKRLECDEIQGYHFCRPNTAEKIADFVVEHQRASTICVDIEQDIA